MSLKRKAGLLRFTTIMPAIFMLLVGLNAAAQSVFPRSLLVRLNPGVSVNSIVQEYGLTVVDGVPDRNVYEVSAVNEGLALATQFFLNEDSRVLYSESEAVIGLAQVHATPFHLAFDSSSDATAFVSQPAYGQVGLGNSGSTPGQNSLIGGSGPGAVTVAVLDTGVDFTHPALAGRLLSGYNATNPGTPPIDGQDGTYATVVGHGTMVAGIVTRVSPNSMILPIRVLAADGLGSMIDVVKGMHYAVLNGAQVINMSFETTNYSLALADALGEAVNAGIVLVASAGNDSTLSPRFPAAYPNVIGVAAVNADNTLASFSDFGTSITLVAPGNSIRSTYWNDEYATWSGTSFAAPFAAAEAAEILAYNQSLSPVQVTFIMVSTAKSVDSVNPGYANMLGAGMIDIQAALNSL